MDRNLRNSTFDNLRGRGLTIYNSRNKVNKKVIIGKGTEGRIETE